jgi:hypothetical protein
MRLPGGWALPARAARTALTLGARAAGRPDLGYALPDFLLIGAMKAGTSTLIAELAAHPHVIRSRRREIHFFGSRYGRGEAWYRTHFPTGWELGRYQAITGEGSTSYLANPAVPARIRTTLPEVKMIALLRDPVERAISNYFHEQRTGREHLPIESAFAAEEERLSSPPPSRRGGRNLAYRRRGLYADQLQRYYALFPREQLLVLRSESLFTEPKEIVDRVCRFLGIDPGLAARSYTPQNLGGYDAAQVPAALYDELTRFYAPHNQRLYAMVGEDWGWRSPTSP